MTKLQIASLEDEGVATVRFQVSEDDRTELMAFDSNAMRLVDMFDGEPAFVEEAADQVEVQQPTQHPPQRLSKLPIVIGLLLLGTALAFAAFSALVLIAVVVAIIAL